MDADRTDFLDALAGVSEPWPNLRDDDAAGRVLLDGFDKVLDALEDDRHDGPDDRETEFRARWEVLTNDEG